jgi:hypothetical protein
MELKTSELEIKSNQIKGVETSVLEIKSNEIKGVETSVLEIKSNDRIVDIFCRENEFSCRW